MSVVGEFLNVKHDRKAGDAWGYSVQLWQSEHQMFGLLAAYVGPEADPPTGLLEDVKFNSKTKQLSFKTRVSTAFVLDANNRSVPSRDSIEFKGTLGRHTIAGTLKLTSATSQMISNKRIRLLRSEMSSEYMIAPKTYGEWRKWANGILERLGPKW
jgi:hypothetical protein